MSAQPDSANTDSVNTVPRGTTKTTKTTKTTTSTTTTRGTGALHARTREFKKYLEQTGVVETLTRALIALYDDSERPNDALSIVRAALAGDVATNPDTETSSALAERTTECETLRAALRAAEERVARVSAERDALAASLHQLQQTSRSDNKRDASQMILPTEEPAAKTSQLNTKSPQLQQKPPQTQQPQQQQQQQQSQKTSEPPTAAQPVSVAKQQQATSQSVLPNVSTTPSVTIPDITTISIPMQSSTSLAPPHVAGTSSISSSSSSSIVSIVGMPQNGVLPLDSIGTTMPQSSLSVQAVEIQGTQSTSTVTNVAFDAQDGMSNFLLPDSSTLNPQLNLQEFAFDIKALDGLNMFLGNGNDTN